MFKASAGRTVVTGFGAIAEPPRTPGSRRDIWFKQMMDPEAHLEAISNNIANGSTVGYKKQRVDFEDLLYQTVRAAGAPTGRAEPDRSVGRPAGRPGWRSSVAR